MVAFGFVLPFLPLYLREIGVGPESAVVFWSGTLVTSTAVALAIASPIWGVIADRREAIHRAIEQARTGDLVLIAGKGHEDYQIIGREVFHFDDKEVAREALN